MSKIPIMRRVVLLIIIIVFLLQFFRVKLLVGGLTGSVAVWYVKLLDIFAYLESIVASGDLTKTALVSVIPIVAIYLIFGRAFCGWVCPMDFLFELVNKTKRWREINISPMTGYVLVLTFLALSYIFSVPVFTNYLSHLTNFFRALTGGIFYALDFPVNITVVMYSSGIILLLLVLEYFFPRLWCRALCPVGRLYGIFNKVSLLKLKFQEGQCKECNVCERVCYMGVNITSHLDQSSLRDTNCIYCGRCVRSCGTKGKLVKIGF
jgi:ferredoxin-type protein NapH